MSLLPIMSNGQVIFQHNICLWRQSLHSLP